MTPLDQFRLLVAGPCVRGLALAGTRDPLLAARLVGERKQIERMAEGLAKRTFTLPWLTVPPIGFAELSKLVSKPSAATVTSC